MSDVASIQIEAPAKLNLFLEVVGRRPDGYHEIDSIFVALDLCDTLRVERAPRMALSVVGSGAPAGESNLVWQAAAALGVPASIQLTKRIPSGAGLGGGSSDAAATLLALDRLYGLDRGVSGLAPIAASLGADVPFFLSAGWARCRGIGERVQSLDPPSRRSFLLLAPAISTSTARVYAALDPGLTPRRESATVFLEYYLGGGGGRYPLFFNRLQEAAEGLDPRLPAVRRAAERRYGRPFTMTGSGSCYFAENDGPAIVEREVWEAEGVTVRVQGVRSREG